MKKSFFILLVMGMGSLKLTAQNPTDSALENRTKALLSCMEQGKYEEAATYFDASVTDKINASVLKKTWAQVSGKLGEVKSTGVAKTGESNGMKIVFLPCLFEKMTLDLKVPFLENQKAVGFFLAPHTDDHLYTLPEYADTTKFGVEPITVQTGKFKLPGMMTFPKNASGKFPVVILVHGSGPNDMDETIGPNKPFKDLAYGLATKGIAVIRYDKRTKVYASQMTGKTNITLEEETIQDALSAIKLAKTMPGVDTNRIFVLGHSLGAMCAPRIADYTGKVLAGIIMLAGNARPLEDLIWEQMNYLSTLNNSPKNKKELSELKIQIEKVKNGELSPKTPSEQLPLGVPANYWLYLNAYHQAEIAKKLKLPVLVLQGERDCQVTMTDFELWKQAFNANKKATCKSYPKLNHLFMEGAGKSTPSEYNIPAHVAGYTVDDIARFVNQH